MTAQNLREIVGGEPLTDTELAVLGLAADGLTAEQTGRELCYSTETIREHRKTATAKLEARNLTHAVVLLVRRGLLG